MLTLKKENKIIRGGLIIFWLLFWLLNTIDKLITKEVTLWVGKDRISQLTTYFSSIGIENIMIPKITLTIIGLLEFIALVFFSISLYYYVNKNLKKARHLFFLGIFTSIVIFSFFAIGDQIFGDRTELLEHSIYWISSILSWYIFSHSYQEKIEK